MIFVLPLQQMAPPCVSTPFNPCSPPAPPPPPKKPQPKKPAGKVAAPKMVNLQGCTYPPCSMMMLPPPPPLPMPPPPMPIAPPCGGMFTPPCPPLSPPKAGSTKSKSIAPKPCLLYTSPSPRD